MKRSEIDSRMVATMLILVMTIAGMGLSGCSASKPQTAELEPVFQPIEQVTLTFDNPLTVTIPEHDPVTIKDFIQVGLFYFSKEQYASAAEAFHRARSRVINSNCALARQCLVASAICYLVLDDRENFKSTTEQLKASYNRYELMDISSIDNRVSTLLRLSEEFNNNSEPFNN